MTEPQPPRMLHPHQAQTPDLVPAPPPTLTDRLLVTLGLIGLLAVIIFMVTLSTFSALLFSLGCLAGGCFVLSISLLIISELSDE